jgi:hypothetical protein
LFDDTVIISKDFLCVEKKIIFGELAWMEEEALLSFPKIFYVLKRKLYLVNWHGWRKKQLCSISVYPTIFLLEGMR